MMSHHCFPVAIKARRPLASDALHFDYYSLMIATARMTVDLVEGYGSSDLLQKEDYWNVWRAGCSSLKLFYVRDNKTVPRTDFCVFLCVFFLCVLFMTFTISSITCHGSISKELL